MKEKEKSNIIFGTRPIIEAIQSGKEVDKVLIQKGIRGEVYAELNQLLKQRDITAQHVPVEKLNRFTRKNHQGVVGFISPITYQNIEDILPGIYEKGETPLLLILDRISDVRNFGAITRTAECAGVHAIIVPEKGRAMIGPDAIKTSAGALFKIPICKEKSLKQCADYLQQSGLKLVACTEKTEGHYFDVDGNGPLAIIMGSEENGISNDLIRKADYLAKIPLAGKIESLNVSVAAGILMYEIVRQRQLNES
ncbi:MAG: 23S rRNA (guanosine(2251)-2'-O)-methyltransferase RlmB [Flavobacteriales bacterium]|nr:23S rRNA (guanosine(2251)-2'-O)-methyltransferase RlmB [Flavobacteriales bacterium]